MALGNLVRFHLLPGQRYDRVGVAPLINGIQFGGLIADKAFDSNWIIAELTERGAASAIRSIACSSRWRCIGAKGRSASSCPVPAATARKV